MTLRNAADNDRIVLTDNANLQGTGSHTIEAWVKMTALPASGTTDVVMIKGDETTGWGLLLDIINTAGTTTLRGVMTDSAPSSHTATGATALSTGVWYHMALVWNDSANALTLYLNAVQDGTLGSLTGTMRHTGNSAIGCTVGVGAATLIGDIDEVRLWAEARTVDQLVANMNRRIAVESANLKGYWRLDGATAYDFLGVTTTTLTAGATIAADSAPITATTR